MSGQEGSKGMSKGCLIALIVVAVIILLVVIAGVTCYFKKDSLVRYGATTMVDQIKQMAATSPQLGMDTTYFNAVTDKFLEKLKAEEKPDLQKIGTLLQGLQTIPNDKKVDSEEARQFIDALINYYPDIQNTVPKPAVDSAMAPEDSVSVE